MQALETAPEPEDKEEGEDAGPWQDAASPFDNAPGTSGWRTGGWNSDVSRKFACGQRVDRAPWRR